MKLFLYLILLLITNSATATTASIRFENAIKLYHSGQYSDAALLFSQNADYHSRLAQAISLFHAEDIDKAQSVFMRSILLADNDNQRYQSIYNAATCSFLNGDYSKSKNLFEDATKYSDNKQSATEFFKLSVYLERLVLARIGSENTKTDKKRPGSGKKTSNLEDLVFDREANIRLEDSESTESKTKNTFTAIQNYQVLLEQLVKAGIDRVKIKKTITGQIKDYSPADNDNIYSIIDSTAYTPPSSNIHLWQRIFELEQGFPARLEEKEILPGVRPW